jgi:hypothetical protein
LYGLLRAGASKALQSQLVVASGPSQPGNELSVLWRAEAKVEHGAQSPGVAHDECDRVKPQARKNVRAVNPVRAEREVHKAPLADHEPADLVGLERKLR